MFQEQVGQEYEAENIFEGFDVFQYWSSKENSSHRRTMRTVMLLDVFIAKDDLSSPIINQTSWRRKVCPVFKVKSLTGYNEMNVPIICFLVKQTGED